MLVGGHMQIWITLSGFLWNHPAVPCIFSRPPPTFDGTSSQVHLLAMHLTVISYLLNKTLAHFLWLYILLQISDDYLKVFFINLLEFLCNIKNSWMCVKKMFTVQMLQKNYSVHYQGKTMEKIRQLLGHYVTHMWNTVDMGSILGHFQSIENIWVEKSVLKTLWESYEDCFPYRFHGCCPLLWFNQFPKRHLYLRCFHHSVMEVIPNYFSLFNQMLVLFS